MKRMIGAALSLLFLLGLMPTAQAQNALERDCPYPWTLDGGETAILHNNGTGEFHFMLCQTSGTGDPDLELEIDGTAVAKPVFPGASNCRLFFGQDIKITLANDVPVGGLWCPIEMRSLRNRRPAE